MSMLTTAPPIVLQPVAESTPSLYDPKLRFSYHNPQRPGQVNVVALAREMAQRGFEAVRRISVRAALFRPNRRAVDAPPALPLQPALFEMGGGGSDPNRTYICQVVADQHGNAVSARGVLRVIYPYGVQARDNCMHALCGVTPGALVAYGVTRAQTLTGLVYVVDAVQNQTAAPDDAPPAVLLNLRLVGVQQTVWGSPPSEWLDPELADRHPGIRRLFQVVARKMSEPQRGALNIEWFRAVRYDPDSRRAVFEVGDPDCDALRHPRVAEPEDFLATVYASVHAYRHALFERCAAEGRHIETSPQAPVPCVMYAEALTTGRVRLHFQMPAVGTGTPVAITTVFAEIPESLRAEPTFLYECTSMPELVDKLTHRSVLRPERGHAVRYLTSLR